MSEPDLSGIDPARVTDIRASNALWPGMTAFVGVSFFVYLVIKLAGGLIEPTLANFGQIGVSFLLLAIGGWALRRGRYFRVTVLMGRDRRIFSGLSKAEQTALMERLGGASAVE